MESGPDAGGIHLLHGGRVRLGRSAEADVVLDDPDVSRLHCAVTVLDGGEVTVTDLGSTNGTCVDGRDVDDRPALLGPDSSLYLGESALRLVTSARPAAPPELSTTPDGEGRLRLGGGSDGPGLPHGAGQAGPWAAAGPAATEGLVPGQAAPTAAEITHTQPSPQAPTVHGTGLRATGSAAAPHRGAAPARPRHRRLGPTAGRGRGREGPENPGGSGRQAPRQVRPYPRRAAGPTRRPCC